MNSTRSNQTIESSKTLDEGIRFRIVLHVLIRL